LLPARPTTPFVLHPPQLLVVLSAELVEPPLRLFLLETHLGLVLASHLLPMAAQLLLVLAAHLLLLPAHELLMLPLHLLLLLPHQLLLAKPRLLLLLPDHLLLLPQHLLLDLLLLLLLLLLLHPVAHRSPLTASEDDDSPSQRPFRAMSRSRRQPKNPARRMTVVRDGS